MNDNGHTPYEPPFNVRTPPLLWIRCVINILEYFKHFPYLVMDISDINALQQLD